jgi:acetoin utilization protein AcuB
MLVKDLMIGNVVTIEASESCHAAVERMVRARIRHLPVVDERGRLVGIVTDRDLRHHLFAPGVFSEIGRIPVDSHLRDVPVARIMSTPVATVAPGDALEAAARLMLEDKIGSLPVVEDGRVVGIITETDLLRRILREDACCQEVETIVIAYP